MAEPEDSDELLAERLLAVLRGEEFAAPADLPDRTIRKVQALLSARDMIDLTTAVFLLRFCVPLLELVAAAFGANLPDPDRRRDE